MRFCFLLSLILSLAPSAQAQDIVADLSQSRVAITASFAGSQILVFGAVKPEPGIADDEPLSVVVTVSGPQSPVMVRKKDRVAGIWVNREALEIDLAPSLYKVVTSGPMEEILSETSDLRHSISIPQAIRSVGDSHKVGDSEEFIDALIRIRMDEGLYGLDEGAVSLAEQTLFRTDVALPANLVEGDYTARIFLTRNRQVVAEYEQVLDVRKVGIERLIYNLAHEHALIYGILSLVIAIAAGWGASALFRYARGS